MGRASAHEIFDPVVKKMLELNLPPSTLKDLTGALLESLLEYGWDTEEESLGELQYLVGAEPVIAAFNERGYIAESQWSDDGRSTIAIRCRNCGTPVFFTRDDDGEQADSHMDRRNPAHVAVCPYSLKDPRGY